MTPVEHDAAGHRFTAEVEGQRAVLDYAMSGGVMTITHTGVPQVISRRGVAAELMRAALTTARAVGWTVVPACSYAAAYLAKHPEFAELRLEPDGPRGDFQHESDLLDEALDESFPASDSPSIGRSS